MDKHLLLSWEDLQREVLQGEDFELLKCEVIVRFVNKILRKMVQNHLTSFTLSKSDEAGVNELLNCEGETKLFYEDLFSNWVNTKVILNWLFEKDNAETVYLALNKQGFDVKYVPEKNEINIKIPCLDALTKAETMKRLVMSEEINNYFRGKVPNEER